MKRLFGEDWVCAECGFEGEPEKSYENLWDKEDTEEIIYVCPECHSSQLVGQRHAGEEFFY